MECSSQYRKGKTYDNRHWKLLPWHTTWTVWVHKNPHYNIPEHTIQQYNMKQQVKGGYIYLEIRKAIWDLPQEDNLANTLLKEHIDPKGFHEVPHTPGQWKYITKDIQFPLVIDDFDVKYTKMKYIEYLL